MPALLHFQSPTYGYLQEVSDAFHHGAQQSMHLSSETWTPLLRSCIKSRDAYGARILHAISMEFGYECSTKLGCQFIMLYASSGFLLDAVRIFWSFNEHTSHTWTSIIVAHAEHGQCKQAISLYEKMRISRVNANPSTFVAVFKACAGAEALAEGRLIHSDLKKNGLEIDLRTGNTIIDMYCKCNSIHDARRVFDRLQSRNVVSWNTILTGYVHNGLNDEALGILEDMHKNCIFPSNITFICQLKLYTSMKDLESGKMIHIQVNKRGIEPDVMLGNSLLNMYVKCNEIEAAQLVFDKLHIQNVVAWSGMIQGYAENGYGEEAIKMFVKMQKKGIQPDEVVYVCILKACATIRAFEQGNLIYGEMIKRNIALSVFTGSILVVMYTKCGSISDARRAFDRLTALNVVSWSSMIEAYVEQGQGEESLNLFKDMYGQSVMPNRITFLSVIKACLSLSTLDQGMVIHGCTIEQGFESDSLIRNSLVDMYAKCGSLCNAVSLLNLESIESISALIAGYANHGHLEMAKYYFQKMCDQGIESDIIAFLSLIYACSHSGLLDEGCSYFRSMIEEFRLVPTMEHYACLVDMFGRVGILNEAEYVIEKMPFAPDSVVWKALLSSCTLHMNVEVGRRAFNSLLSYDCGHAAGYVLMSNISVAIDLSEDF